MDALLVVCSAVSFIFGVLTWCLWMGMQLRCGDCSDGFAYHYDRDSCFQTAHGEIDAHGTVNYARCPCGYALSGPPYRCYNFDNATQPFATYVCPAYVNTYHVFWYIWLGSFAICVGLLEKKYGAAAKQIRMCLLLPS